MTTRGSPSGPGRTPARPSLTALLIAEAVMLLFGRTTPRVVPWAVGWAVRRDWTVDGSHEYVGFRVTRGEAELFLTGDRRYWRRCPVRPRYSIVPISTVDFELHLGRHLCRSLDCPIGTSVVSLHGLTALMDGEVR